MKWDGWCGAFGGGTADQTWLAALSALKAEPVAGTYSVLPEELWLLPWWLGSRHGAKILDRVERPEKEELS